jgi:hypothetical protein
MCALARLVDYYIAVTGRAAAANAYTVSCIYILGIDRGGRNKGRAHLETARGHLKHPPEIHVRINKRGMKTLHSRAYNNNI